MTLAAGKVWQFIAAQDDEPAELLARELSLPLPIARLLVARGFADLESADRFLNPRLSALGDPFDLPGLNLAADRVWRALDAGERIVVFGDYDVDGITSTALLVQVLRQLGADVQPFLPHRLDEGYGLGLDALNRCIETCHPALIITVDCGTGSVEAVLEAQKRGVDVMVTDHHQPGQHIAPALAVVNPKLGADERLHNLAGVGVAFKVCHGIAKQGRALGRTAAAGLDLKPYLDLVALGTIADIVPLVDENRILARHGLSQINQTLNVGLAALIEVVGIHDRVDAYEVGFQLGPRLNAAGRLGDAQRALDLLLGRDASKSTELAVELDRSNRERQRIEAQTLKEALEDLGPRFDPDRDRGLVVGRPGWHPGVVGIVASRLLQRFYRPVAVIALSDEGGRGSCRSIEGFDMMAGLNACADDLAKFGGHTMAAGLELKPGRLDSFAAAFNQAAAALLKGRDLRPVQRIDAWIGLDEVDNDLISAMDRMRPFGLGNSTPVWAARSVRVVGVPRVVGQGHLKLLLATGGRQIEAMGWGMAGRLLPSGPMDVAFQVKRDRYRGQERLVLHLQDFRPAEY